MTKLSITRLRVDLSGDQFFTQCPATKAGLIKQSGGGIATDFNAALKQALRQLHWLEVCPAHALIGRTASAVYIENLLQSRLQQRLALGDRRSTSAGPARSLGVSAGALRVLRIVVAHLLQLAYPRVDRTATHAQHPCNIGYAAITNLQRLDRGIAAPMIFRQRPAVQPHRFLVDCPVTRKFVHGDAPSNRTIGTDARNNATHFQDGAGVAREIT